MDKERLAQVIHAAFKEQHSGADWVGVKDLPFSTRLDGSFDLEAVAARVISYLDECGLLGEKRDE